MPEMMNETGSSDELDMFETETMTVLELTMTHEPAKVPMRASLHRVGATGALLMWVSRFDPIKLTKFWPQHRAVCEISTAHV